MLMGNSIGKWSVILDCELCDFSFNWVELWVRCKWSKQDSKVKEEELPNYLLYVQTLVRVNIY